MSVDHFSSVCRETSHKCLAFCGLELDNPNTPAKNLGINICDIIVSTIYYGINILYLWLGGADWLVLLLSMLCLAQAFLRTCIKRKDCGKRLRNIQMGNSGGYFLPYTGLGGIEILCFGIDIAVLYMLYSVVDGSDPGLIRILKIAATLTIAVTFFDGLISSLENVYPAHPRIRTMTVE